MVLTSLDDLCFHIELMILYKSEEVTGKSGTAVVLLLLVCCNYSLGCWEMDDRWGAIKMWIDSAANILWYSIHREANGWRGGRLGLGNRDI